MLRVTEIIAPLTQEKFNNIPTYMLDIKRDEGIAYHKRAEQLLKSKGSTQVGSMEYLLLEGLKRIEVDSNGQTEVELINNEFMGHCDYIHTVQKVICDWKFTIDCATETSLQLCGYNLLAGGDHRLFCFHFIEGNHGLMVYQVNPNCVKLLTDFLVKLYQNHQLILDDDFALIDIKNEWEQIQENNNIWLPAVVIYHPLTITDDKAAEVAVQRILAFKDIESFIKSERVNLMRYMQDYNLPNLEFEGGKIRLQNKKVPKYELTLDAQMRISALKDRMSDIENKILEIKEQYRIDDYVTQHIVITENKKNKESI